MDSSNLIQSLMQILDQARPVTEGEKLAEGYVAAVDALNQRLNAIQGLTDAGRMSEAIQKMDEDPAVEDEAHLLNFHRLSEWQKVCAKECWPLPQLVDVTLLERCEKACEKVREALEAHRKASRTRNTRLDIEALHKLLELDKSQDWKVDLAQAEEAFEEEIVTAFLKAKGEKDFAKAAELAREFAGFSWREAPKQNGTEEIRAFLDELKRKELEDAGAAALAQVREYMEGEWNTTRAGLVLEKIRNLEERGFELSYEARELVEKCRVRIRKEKEIAAEQAEKRRQAAEEEAKRKAEEEEFNAKWQAACEALKAALETKKGAEIQGALSAAEFSTRPAKEELLVAVNEFFQCEKKKRMRRILLSVGVFVVICIASGVVLNSYMQRKAFNERCEREVTRLAAIAKKNTSESEKRLAEALSLLKKSAPKVYADGRIKEFVQILKDKERARFDEECAAVTNRLTTLLKESDGEAKFDAELRILQTNAPAIYADARLVVFMEKAREMKEEYRVRAQAIAKLLDELNELKAQKAWGQDVNAVTSRIARLHASVPSSDTVAQAKLNQIVTAWDKFVKDVGAAKEQHAQLLVQIARVTRRLKTEVLPEADNLQIELDRCKEEIERWKVVNETYALNMWDDVAGAERLLRLAEKSQEYVQEALKKLKESRTIGDYLRQRDAILEQFSTYNFTKHMREYIAPANQVEGLVKGTASVLQANKSRLSRLSASAFQDFLEAEVFSLTNAPFETALYGVYYSAQRTPLKGLASKESRKFVGLSKGEAQVQYEGESSTVAGNLYEISDEPGMRLQFRKPRACPLQVVEMGSSAELNALIRFAARDDMTSDKFEQEILRLIDLHLRSGLHADNTPDTWYPSIRRVQMVMRYFRWLRKGLNALPMEGALGRCYNLAEQLAEPIDVEHVPSAITWACLKNESVLEREKNCREYLSELAKNDFVGRYRRARHAHESLEQIAGWRIEFVGSLNCPSLSSWRKNPKKLYLSIPGDVKDLEFPLYILRRENGQLILKRILEANKVGTGYHVVAGRGKDVLAGDPLFQVKFGTHVVDIEQFFTELKEESPEIGLTSAAPFFVPAAK